MTEPYLTEERRMIQDVAREFTRNEVLPVANELDPVQGQIPMELRNKMGEMGYFAARRCGSRCQQPALGRHATCRTEHNIAHDGGAG